MSNPVCFFDMSIGGQPAGRIEMTVSPPLFPCPNAVPTPASPDRQISQIRDRERF
jgi:hypothetical protein